MPPRIHHVPMHTAWTPSINQHHTSLMCTRIMRRYIYVDTPTWIHHVDTPTCYWHASHYTPPTFDCSRSHPVIAYRCHLSMTRRPPSVCRCMVWSSLHCSSSLSGSCAPGLRIRDRVSFIKKDTSLAPTKPSTRKPARLRILLVLLILLHHYV